MKKSLLFTLLMAVFAITISSCSSSESKLQTACEAANKMCPMNADHGMDISSIEFTDGNVVYTVTVDEAIYGDDAIAQFDAVKDQMKAAMKQALVSGADKSMAEMAKLCKEANANVIFNYVGSKSGNTCTIEIASDEL